MKYSMKKLLNNLLRLVVIISISSRAPKYTAHFQQTPHKANRLAKLETKVIDFQQKKDQRRP